MNTVPAICLACTADYDAHIGDERGICSHCLPTADHQTHLIRWALTAIDAGSTPSYVTHLLTEAEDRYYASGATDGHAVRELVRLGVR